MRWARRGRAATVALMLRFVLAAALLSGCYLSHGREEAVDAGTRRDSGSRIDAATPDARVEGCTGVRLAETRLIEGAPSVTPRLVALPGGDVGVVHVSRDGSPTRVRFDRLDATLTPISSGTVATDSFTWAEPVSLDGALFVAWGLAGDEGSVLQPVDADGAPNGPRSIVPLRHPSVLRAAAGSLFWMAFDMREDNTLVMAHVEPSGELSHPPARVPLGRYGSGHGAIARPDRRSHVITYPREGPRGVRNAYVSALDATGALGPERMLGEDGDQLALPVRLGERLVVVHHGDALVLQVTDADSLELLERFVHPARDSRPFFVGALGGRLLVGHATEGELRMDDFGEELATEHARIVIRPDGPRVNGPSGSVLETPGALYVAVGTVSGTETRPLIARIVCTFD